jgi:hypothetical protein
MSSDRGLGEARDVDLCGYTPATGFIHRQRIFSYQKETDLQDSQPNGIKP